MNDTRFAVIYFIIIERSFVSCILSCLICSVKSIYIFYELTVKQMIIREVIQFFMVEIIILLFSFGFSGFRIENLNMMAIVALSVAAVYISVWVIRFFLDSRKAKKMTDDLKMFQKSLSGKAN